MRSLVPTACAILLADGAHGLMASPQLHLSRAKKLHAPHVAQMASAASQSAAEISQAEDLVANSQSLFFAPRVRSPAETVSNVLSGFTVSLAMIPEAVAFAFVAGVSPIVGLQVAKCRNLHHAVPRSPLRASRRTLRTSYSH